MKRTPIEQIIAEKTDPQARFQARKRAAGYLRTTMYVPQSDALLMKDILRRLGADHEAGRGDEGVPETERVSTRLRHVLDQLAPLDDLEASARSTDHDAVSQAEAA